MSDPVSTENDQLTLYQTCWTVEGEEPTSSDGFIFRTASKYSGDSPDDGDGEAASISDNGDYVEYEFTPNYTIPASDFQIWVRDEAPGPDSTPEVTITFDGEEVITVPHSDTGGTVVFGWEDLTDGPYGNDEWTPSNDIDTTTHTIRAEVTQTASDPYVLDVVAPLDGRFNYTFDDTVTTVNGNNYLDGPELYPESVTVPLDSISTRRDLTTAYVTLTIDDTTGAQAIEISSDGVAWDTVSNSSTAEVTFSEPTTEVYVRLVIGRYPTGTNAQESTPRYGYNAQSIDDYELVVDITAIAPQDVGTANIDATVEPGTITGETLREAAQLNDSNVALTRSTFAEFTVETAMSVISSENISFNNP